MRFELLKTIKLTDLEGVSLVEAAQIFIDIAVSHQSDGFASIWCETDTTSHCIDIWGDRGE